MRETRRSKLGRWLEKFPILHPLILDYSHEYPSGRHHYTNKISRTMVTKESR